MLATAMSNLHKIGISLGALLMVVGYASRLLAWAGLFCQLCCCPSVDQRPMRANTCLPIRFNDRVERLCSTFRCVQNELRIGRPEWVVGGFVDFMIFALFVLSATLFVGATGVVENAHKSHICILYDNEIECRALDLDLNASSANRLLQPWPCIWNNATARHSCTNPNCDYADFAREVVFEFWVLTFSVMVVAAYQCRKDEFLPMMSLPGVEDEWTDRKWCVEPADPASDAACHTITQHGGQYCWLCIAARATMVQPPDGIAWQANVGCCAHCGCCMHHVAGPHRPLALADGVTDFYQPVPDPLARNQDGRQSTSHGEALPLTSSQTDQQPRPFVNIQHISSL
jgi:hypothetical protein